MAQRKAHRGPMYGPPRAPYGLCPLHRTPLLEQGTECWDCEGAPPATREISLAMAAQLPEPLPHGDGTGTRHSAVKANRYGGRCDRCSQWVEEGAGQLVKVDGKWGARHLDGACPAPRPQRPDTAPAARPTAPAGWYALETGDGARNGLAFYQVDHGAKGGRWEGWTFLSLLVGPDRTPIKGAAAAAVLARIAADPETAARRYGREIGACGRCGRRLTNDSSRADGIGPECATKGWM